jgi:hypothetical protein
MGSIQSALGEKSPGLGFKNELLAHSKWCVGVVCVKKRDHRKRLPRVAARFMPTRTKTRGKPAQLAPVWMFLERACGLDVDLRR